MDSPASATTILSDADHRPYPLPHRRWSQRQRWCDVGFLHWPLRPEMLQGRLPAALELDTFDGEAWLGVVPFRMQDIHWRGFPPIPGLSAFPELNVRTYVRSRGRPGVWFFSLDAANAVAVWVARRLFHLPYFRAKMRCVGADGGNRWIEYSNRRTHRGAPAADFRARYGSISGERRAVPGSLEYFLTERYCLFAQDARGKLWRGDIHHKAWPLRRGAAEIEMDTMAASHGLLLPDRPPLVYYAAQLEVLIWSIVPES